MLFPDLNPQFPLFKEKVVNKSDHNEILTFTPRPKTKQKWWRIQVSCRQKVTCNIKT